MNEHSIINLEKELEVTDLSGEKVMIDFTTGKYFLLKGTANDIWDILKSGITVDTIIQELMGNYEVDEAVCKKAVFDFLKQLEEYGFISVA